MQVVEAFEARSIPKFTKAEERSRLPAYLIAQNAFWSAVRASVAGKHGCVIEHRIESLPKDHSLRVLVMVWSDLEHYSTEGLLQRLLPRNYEWRQLYGGDLHACTVGRTEGPFYIGRLIRRSEYVDLPRVVLNRSEPAPGSPASAAQLREFPTSPFMTREQLNFGRYCIAVLGDFQQTHRNWRELCDVIQRCSPAALSVTLQPSDPTATENDREVGSHFSRFVDLVSEPLSNAGFAKLSSVRSTFDRYSLSSFHIADVRIRIVASSTADCKLLMHAAAEELGGVRAFEIKEPTKDFNTLEALADAGLDFPLLESSLSGWDQIISLLRKRLDGAHIKKELPDKFLRFLVRLPHLYSSAEITSLLTMPVAGMDGLPGLLCRLTQPFSAPSILPDPIVDATGKIRSTRTTHLRIGRVSLTTDYGEALSSDANLHWHSIPVDDLTKHALIVGSTGSGKTVTTMFLLRELARLKVPFLVVEPVKTEYFSGLQVLKNESLGIRRYRFEGDPDGQEADDFLSFDPMRLQYGVSVARHVSYLKSCFQAAFQMDDWLAILLDNGMNRYYTDAVEHGGCGLGHFTRGSAACLSFVEEGDEVFVYPSFATFAKYLREVYLVEELAASSEETKREVEYAFLRRIENLQSSTLGKAFAKADRQTNADPECYSTFEWLLERNTIVELDGIPDADQKALVMAFLMTSLYERRQADDMMRREAETEGGTTRGDEEGSEQPKVSGVKHVLVLEEAHRLLSEGSSTARGQDTVGMGAREKTLQMFIDMLAEVRAFGQSIVIVEQIPTKLAKDAVKNTNLKVMLRLTATDDRSFLGEAMSFTPEQKKFVSLLRAERGVQVQYVAFDENVDQPVMLSLPLSGQALNGTASLFDIYFQPETPDANTREQDQDRR